MCVCAACCTIIVVLYYFLYCTDMFRSLIGKVYFSEQGTPESAKEKATFMMFLDLLYKIESEHECIIQYHID